MKRLGLGLGWCLKVTPSYRKVDLRLLLVDESFQGRIERLLEKGGWEECLKFWLNENLSSLLEIHCHRYFEG